MNDAKEIKWPVAALMAMSALALQADPVVVTEEPVTLPTYDFSDPDPVPPAADKRYPYFRFDGSSATARSRTFRRVGLSNGRIAVDVLPEVGGKVWGATDLKTGFDFLYRNHAAKFRNVAMRGPWWSGGIEFNFGIIGHSPCTSTPADTFVRRNADGSASIFVSMTEWICRTTYQVEIRLAPDADHFETRTLWFNSSGLPTPYYHWMNSASPAERDMVLEFDGKNEIGHQGDAHPWPFKEGGRDVSVYTNNAYGGNKSYHVINGDNRFFGVWYPSRGLGFRHENEAYGKYGRKAWLWALSREGAIWEDLLTDTDGQYVELQSGRAFNQPRKGTVKTPFKHPTFAPGRTDSFVEKWAVVRDEKAYRPSGTNPPSEAKPRPVESPADFDWSSAYGHYLRGQQALREREDGLGDRELALALARDPNHVPALRESAFLALRRGDNAKAYERATHVLAIDTYDGGANYAAGLAAKRLGDLATAKERFGLATYSAEFRNAAFAWLARIAIAERDYALALTLAERLLEADAANRDALLVKIVALRLQDDFPGGRAAVRKALEIWPLYFAAMFEDRLLGADLHLTGMIRNEFPDETLLEMATWYRETGRGDEARELEEMAAGSPLAKIRLGRYDDAAKMPLPSLFPFRAEDIPALDRAIAAHPSWKFRYYRAVLAASFQDDVTARRLLDACGNEPDDYSFYLFRASCRTGSDKLADLEKAGAVSDNWRIGRDLAAHYAAQAKWSESAAAAKRYLARNPGNNPLQIAYARALNGCKRWRETVDFLKDVNILPSEFGDNACDLWQEAWRNLGDLEKANSYPEHLGKGKPYGE